MEYFEDYYVKAKGLLQSNPSEAYNLLLKCDKMEPNDIGVNNYLFYLEMIFGHYAKAVSRLGLLFRSENDTYVRNLNLYLYLLNKIYDLPEDYQKYASNLRIEDVRLDNPYQTEKINEQNRIRNLIMVNGNPQALYFLNENIKKEQRCSLSNNILRKLLTKLITKHNTEKQIMITLINKKNYSKVIELIEKKKTKGDITKVYNYYLKLLYILVSGEVPSVKSESNVIDKNTMQEAFKDDDFRTLFEGQKKLLEKGIHFYHTSIMYLLLRDVVELLDRQEGKVLKR